MRILGWSASAVGLVGVVTCTTLMPFIWVIRGDLAGRSRKLWAVAETGLEAASSQTDTATAWLGDASHGVRRIAGTAVDLARGPHGDTAAATDLVGAIDAFVAGPYASLRTAYAGLRERAMTVDGMLAGIRDAAPMLAVGAAVADVLQEIDDRMLEVDASVTRLHEMGAADLTAPGTAIAIAEHAAAADLLLQAIGELVAQVRDWLQNGSDRVDAAERQSVRYLTIGAGAVTAVCLFVAGLNVLLFRQGRRLSRR